MREYAFRLVGKQRRTCGRSWLGAITRIKPFREIRTNGVGFVLFSPPYGETIRLIIIRSVISGTLTLAPLKIRYGPILVEEDPRQAWRFRQRAGFFI